MAGARQYQNQRKAEQISEAACENELTDDALDKLFAASSQKAQIQTFSVSRKHWKDYGDLLPQDKTGFEDLFRQFLDWLRVYNGKVS